MKTKKIIAIILSASMLAGCLCSCNSAASTDKQPTKTSASSLAADAAATALSATGSVLEKDETVYVLCAADGNVDKIIVSDWLKNGTGEQTITDPTTLQDIKVVKGNTAYSLNDDNMQVWSADGGDVYYQGTSGDTLPVDVHLSFKLNGQPISAEELDGKSGKVAIRFDYDNHDTEAATVGNRSMNLYVPYLMLSGMVLPEGFTNVQITNGKVIDTGSISIAMGYALPGMNENLSGLNGNVDLPDYVELTADVENFSLAMTLTLAMRDALKDLDLDKLDSLDELEDSMNELDGAAKQLVDGTGELADGLQTLFDSCGDMTDGVRTLCDGGSELNDGAVKIRNNLATLDDGVGDLQKGAGELDDGLGTLLDSAGTMKSGVVDLDDGAGKLYDGLKSLQGKSGELVDGIDQVNSGASDMDDGIQTLNRKVPALRAGVNALYAGINGDNSAENPGLVSGAASLKDGAETVSAGIAKVAGHADTMANGTAALNTAVGKLGRAVSNFSDTDDAVTVLKAMRETYDPGSNEYLSLSSAIAALQTLPELDDSINGEGGLAEKVVGLHTLASGINGAFAYQDEENLGLERGAQYVAAGADTLNTGVGTLKAGVDALKSGTDELASGVGELAAGSTKLSAGTSKLAGSNGELTSGVGQLVSGSSELYHGTFRLLNGTGDLIDGVGKLKSGSSRLLDGTVTLKDGSNKLFDGSVTLANGTGSLLDGLNTLQGGTGDLIDGVTKLRDGSTELDNGMNEFYDKGISKIMETLNDKLPDLLDRFRALCDMASESSTFTGLPDDMDGNVKYVYRTEAIGD